MEKSIGLVTALVPVIGYEQTAAIAKDQYPCISFSVKGLAGFFLRILVII